MVREMTISMFETGQGLRVKTSGCRLPPRPAFVGVQFDRYGRVWITPDFGLIKETHCVGRSFGQFPRADNQMM